MDFPKDLERVRTFLKISCQMADWLWLPNNAELSNLQFCNFNFQLAQVAPRFLVIKASRNLYQFQKLSKHLQKFWIFSNFKESSWKIIIFSQIKLSFKELFSQFYVHLSILKPFDIYSGFHMYIPYQFMSYSGIFWSCLLPNSKYFGGKINITCLPKGYSL